DMRIAHRTVLLVALATIASPLAPAPAASAAAHLAGVKPSEVAVRQDCGPPPPGYARCAAEQLVYRGSGDPVGSATQGARPSASSGEAASPGQQATPSQPASPRSEGPAAGPSVTPPGYGPLEL